MDGRMAHMQTRARIETLVPHFVCARSAIVLACCDTPRIAHFPMKVRHESRVSL